LRVSPRARRLAAERGIDVGELAGSGAGVIVGADLDRVTPEKGSGSGAAATPPSGASGGPGGGGSGGGATGATPSERAARQPASAPNASSDPKAAMRTAIANLMSRSNAEIPHYYVSHTMDVSSALAWLESHNAELPAARRVLPAALFLRATVLAASEVPDLNGHWIDGALVRSERVDLGVAVATRGGGLVTPALPDVGEMPIDELMAALVDLVGRARRGKLRQSQMAGASITVSSLGETGPDALFGVIFPPQVALVGVGGIIDRPWAVAGMLAVRPTVTITLAADHRASDGRTASAFLATFDRALQNPEEL
jgi:pyruvate dehydrogenase E2 component (dihydrolipoamide acetyltransferase)